MDQENDNLNADSKLALKWASDVLDLELPSQTIGDVGDRAVAAFFDSLHSNDFYAETDSAAAVEVLCGNSVSKSPAYLRYKKQQNLRHLDKTLDWFAHQLGVTVGPDLMKSLHVRLASLSLEDCSGDVQDYARKIWSTAEVVKSQAKTSERQLQNCGKLCFTFRQCVRLSVVEYEASGFGS